jgi:hypothetical protein
MTWNIVTPEVASQWAGYVWMLLGLVWLVKWFGMKRAKKVEAPWEMLQHAQRKLSTTASGTKAVRRFMETRDAVRRRPNNRSIRPQ